MTSLRHGKYIGLRADLVGRSALFRKSPVRGEVLAQFDLPWDVELDQRGYPTKPELYPECFGWHPFAAGEFVLDVL